MVEEGRRTLAAGRGEATGFGGEGEFREGFRKEVNVLIADLPSLSRPQKVRS